ncbi:MAG: hypothetical protein JO044_07415 [Mycobacteriaceae bacterium]|nr:hypothetical protein [Mycobacteriaceae bacterium]MBV9641777.1 hypothetical protein [Mycobacteriaceae bacterium]
MRRLLARYRDGYGSRPLHLLTMLAGFALVGYVVATFHPVTLWNPRVWWQSIAVWFAAAIVLHDLVLYPMYALADRLLAIPANRRRGAPVVSALNHIRIPALASGLTLLVFLPGIIAQGGPTYLAATGQTQEPFLGRWLLLTAAMFGTSAALYGIRIIFAHRRSARVLGSGRREAGHHPLP